MRLKRRAKLEKGLRTLDFTPLIDVVFLLLIFFMLTSSFIFQPGIRINLPKAITSEALGKDNIVITVTAENLIYVNSKIATITELGSVLKEASGFEQPVLIKADKRAALGRIVEIWDICRQEGVSKVNIATEQEKR